MRRNLTETPAPVVTFRNFVKKYNDVDNRTKHEWDMTLTDLMAGYGFNALGRGKYASVYGHPSYQYVIKVFMKDAAYLRWLNFCMGHPNNPYCTKVRGRVVRIDHNFMAVRLEKLTEYRGYDSPDAILYHASEDLEEPNAKQVVDFLESNYRLLDLHDGNFMTRPSDGHLVVVDPFYNWFKGGGFTIDPHDLTDLKNLF